jgi:Transglutaminase-like superfamily
MPFPRFQKLLAWLRASPSVKRGTMPTTEQLARDVRVVSSYVPRATCLTHALAGQVLLTHYGYPTNVHVGVTKAEGQGTFQAHAWLESDGKVVIGQSEQPYVPLTTAGSDVVL